MPLLWERGSCRKWCSSLGDAPCLAHKTASCSMEGLRDFTSPHRGSSNSSMKVYTMLASNRSETITDTYKKI